MLQPLTAFIEIQWKSTMGKDTVINGFGNFDSYIKAERSLNRWTLVFGGRTSGD